MERVPEVIVTAPLAASTALTIPPAPCCHPSCSASRRFAMSVDFIRTSLRAVRPAAPSAGAPITRTRSPTARSVIVAGWAVFRSVLPAASCTTFVSPSRATATFSPLSVVRTRAVGLMVSIVPIWRAVACVVAVAGACVACTSTGTIENSRSAPTAVKHLRCPILAACL